MLKHFATLTALAAFTLIGCDSDPAAIQPSAGGSATTQSASSPDKSLGLQATKNESAKRVTGNAVSTRKAPARSVKLAKATSKAKKQSVAQKKSKGKHKKIATKQKSRKKTSVAKNSKTKKSGSHRLAKKSSKPRKGQKRKAHV